MRLVSGARSFLRKLVEIDATVVSYQLLGPNPPRIVYLGPAVGIVGLIVALVRNPTAVVAFVACVFVAPVFFFYFLFTISSPPLCILFRHIFRTLSRRAPFVAQH